MQPIATHWYINWFGAVEPPVVHTPIGGKRRSSKYRASWRPMLQPNTSRDTYFPIKPLGQPFGRKEIIYGGELSYLSSLAWGPPNR